MEEAIANGLTAEAAVEKVQSDNRACMSRHADPYLRNGCMTSMILHSGCCVSWSAGRMGQCRRNCRDCTNKSPAIWAQPNFDYSRSALRGLVIEEGTPTSHVVTVAKALGIPVVGQIGDVVGMAESGNPIIVDGDEGMAFLRPPADVKPLMSRRCGFAASRQAQFAALRDELSVTRDGVSIELHMNAGLAMDLAQLELSVPPALACSARNCSSW
ncbi:MAG: PEP-utilizing enzyme [Nitratireductor sp.]